MGRVFRVPDRWRMFWRQMSKEMEKQGIRVHPYHANCERVYGCDYDLTDKAKHRKPIATCLLYWFGNTRLYLAGVLKHNPLSAAGGKSGQ